MAGVLSGDSGGGLDPLILMALMSQARQAQMPPIAPTAAHVAQPMNNASPSSAPTIPTRSQSSPIVPYSPVFPGALSNPQSTAQALGTLANGGNTSSSAGGGGKGMGGGGNNLLGNMLGGKGSGVTDLYMGNAAQAGLGDFGGAVGSDFAGGAGYGASLAGGFF